MYTLQITDEERRLLQSICRRDREHALQRANDVDVEVAAPARATAQKRVRLLRGILRQLTSFGHSDGGDTDAVLRLRGRDLWVVRLSLKATTKHFARWIETQDDEGSASWKSARDSMLRAKGILSTLPRDSFQAGDYADIAPDEVTT